MSYLRWMVGILVLEVLVMLVQLRTWRRADRRVYITLERK